MSPLAIGVAATVVLVVAANVAVLAVAIWLSTRPAPKGPPPLLLQGGNVRRRRASPHRNRKAG